MEARGSFSILDLREQILRRLQRGEGRKVLDVLESGADRSLLLQRGHPRRALHQALEELGERREDVLVHQERSGAEDLDQRQVREHLHFQWEWMRSTGARQGDD